MGTIINIITSPLALPINPILEWIILSIVGKIAFIFAYDFVGDLDLDNSGIMSIIHLFIRVLIFVVVWFVLNRLIVLGQWIIGLFS